MCLLISCHQLCVTINNIEQVRKSLAPMPEMLQFNEILTTLEANNVKNRSKYDLNLILNNADKQMVGKIKNVVDRVADKVTPLYNSDQFWSFKLPCLKCIVEDMSFFNMASFVSLMWHAMYS